MKIKSKLSEISAFFKLRLALKENNVEEFSTFFPEYLKEMENSFSYEECVRIVRKDCNLLIQVALEGKQRKPIEQMLSCDLIDPNEIEIEVKNNKSYDSKIIHFFMLKLLGNGYYIGNGDGVFSDWITSSVLEEFLNTQVKEDGIHGCKTDYTFLIDPKYREKSSNVLMFCKSMTPFKTIINNIKMKILITHPVLSSYITMKSKRSDRLSKIQFFIFLFFYVLPFFVIIFLISLKKSLIKDVIIEINDKTQDEEDSYPDYENEIDEHGSIFLEELNFIDFDYIFYFCVFTSVALLLREILQMVLSIKTYFKEKTNQIDILLIFFSFWLLFSISTYKENLVYSGSHLTKLDKDLYLKQDQLIDVKLGIYIVDEDGESLKNKSTNQLIESLNDQIKELYKKKSKGHEKIKSEIAYVLTPAALFILIGEFWSSFGH